jgi:hypothetical protein
MNGITVDLHDTPIPGALEYGDIELAGDELTGE